MLNKTEIVFDSDFEPFLSFEFVAYFVCFVQQKKSGDNYYRTYRCFSFDGNTGKATDVTHVVVGALKNEMKRSGISYGSDKTIVNDLTDTRKLIAIFYDFHLFDENHVITYCPSHSYFFNLGVSSLYFNCIQINIQYNCLLVQKRSESSHRLFAH